MKYLVLIGDIVDSRRLPARAQFQRRMKGLLQAVNNQRKSLASPYTLTLGDEFQAVYRNADTAFADVFCLLAEIAPVRARFALAIGEIVTPINPAQSIGMDGPAFHRARSVLGSLKARRRMLGVAGPPGGPVDTVLGQAALAVLSGQIEGWRLNRFKLFARLLAGDSTAGLAKYTGITTRAVNKNIAAADLDEWKRILDEITRLLNAELKSR
jgi:hypothetical protein